MSASTLEHDILPILLHWLGWTHRSWYLQMKSPNKSRSPSPLPDWLSQSSTPAKPLEILDDSDDDADEPDKPADLLKASKGEVEAVHEEDVTRSKANGLKRGRAVLQNSSDSEGPSAQPSAQKRPKVSRSPQKKAATPAKASKPGKLQQKGIAAFMKKPGAASAEPEDQPAEQAKAIEPTQASQTPVRQQHDAHDACNLKSHTIST